MAAKLIEIRISDGTDFGSAGNDDANLYFPKTNIGQVVGLLDNAGKIDIELIPSYLFGSPKFLETIGSNTTALALMMKICEKASTLGFESLEFAKGLYFQAEANVSIDFSVTEEVGGASHPALLQYFGDVLLSFAHTGDDEPLVDSALTLTLEANDLLVFSRVDELALETQVSFSVINNVYSNATTELKGVVKLATDDDIITGTNTTKGVTPAGAKKAVQTFGYAHPTLSPTLSSSDDITTAGLRTIKSITLSTDGSHIVDIKTIKVLTSSNQYEGLVRTATGVEARGTIAEVAALDEGISVSPYVAKLMIDYWGKVDYFSTLTLANESELKSVAGKMILVGV